MQEDGERDEESTNVMMQEGTKQSIYTGCNIAKDEESGSKAELKER